MSEMCLASKRDTDECMCFQNNDTPAFKCMLHIANENIFAVVRLCP